ncbi:hypothetical protein PR048_026961 [Dryococelus australis]|uniref:Uncharacterized protein n=1 Tax=Dryococelus australis TaxID=614101 RepID=A0ABQ9GMQ3_9NEOP|nr:hypothetical protein PR048_026961 [Dryococelus australis]
MMERLLEQREAIAADLVSKDLQALFKFWGQLIKQQHGCVQTNTRIQSVLECHIEKKEHRSGIMFARSLLKSLKSGFPLYTSGSQSVLAMMLDPLLKSLLLESHEKISTGKKLLLKLKGVFARLHLQKLNMTSHKHPQAQTIVLCGMHLTSCHRNRLHLLHSIHH